MNPTLRFSRADKRKTASERERIAVLLRRESRREKRSTGAGTASGKGGGRTGWTIKSG